MKSICIVAALGLVLIVLADGKAVGESPDPVCFVEENHIVALNKALQFHRGMTNVKACVGRCYELPGCRSVHVSSAGCILNGYDKQVAPNAYAEQDGTTYAEPCPDVDTNEELNMDLV